MVLSDCTWRREKGRKEEERRGGERRGGERRRKRKEKARGREEEEGREERSVEESQSYGRERDSTFLLGIALTSFATSFTAIDTRFFLAAAKSSS